MRLLGLGLGVQRVFGLEGVQRVPRILKEPVVCSDSSLSERRAPPTGHEGSSGVRSTW